MISTDTTKEIHTTEHHTRLQLHMYWLLISIKN